MTWKAFILGFLILISIDLIVGFLLWLLYKYIDLKYFSNFEISTLKEEIEYLRKENKKIGGSSDFWSKDKIKL